MNGTVNYNGIDGYGVKTVKKKNAYLGMSLATSLLFAIPVFSIAVSFIVQTVVVGNYTAIESAFADFICLFGVGRMQAVTAVKNLFSSSAFSCFVDLVLTLLTMVFPAFLFSKLAGMNSYDRFPANGKLVKGFFRIYCAMQLVVLFAGVLSTELYEFLIPESKIHPGGFTDYSGVEFDGYALVMRIILTCIFVPLAEEYVFRGVLFGFLKRYGLMYGVFASAALFGIAHSSPSQSVYAFVFGLFSAFLAAYTGNIKTSVLYHGMNNLISVLNEHISAYASPQALDLFNGAYNIIMVFAGFAGLYLLAKKDGLAEEFSDKCREQAEENQRLCGMKDIFVVPLVLYVVIYAVGIVIQAV